MYSYAWSEGLACLFFFKYASSLDNITSLEYQYILKEAEEELVKLKKRKAEIEGKKPEDNKKKPIEGLPPDSVIVFGKVIEKGKQVGYIENGKFMPGIRRS